MFFVSSSSYLSFFLLKITHNHLSPLLYRLCIPLFLKQPLLQLVGTLRTCILPSWSEYSGYWSSFELHHFFLFHGQTRIYSTVMFAFVFLRRTRQASYRPLKSKMNPNHVLLSPDSMQPLTLFCSFHHGTGVVYYKRLCHMLSLLRALHQD